MDSDKIKELIKKNHNYWQSRALDNELNTILNEEDYLRRLKSIYDKASKDIDDKVAQVYARYAKENKLTMDEAYSILPKKIEKEYKNDLADYISKAKSGDPKWYNYLLNQSLMRKHTVLDELRTNLRKTVYEIDSENTQGKFLEKIYTSSNYKAQYEADLLGQLETFTLIDKDKIEALLRENWSSGGGFSENIWKNKDQLVKALDDILVKGFGTGDSYEKMSKALAKRMDTSYKNAMRLIRTEASRMSTQGSLTQYKEMGVTQVINIATLDDRTSDICMSIDGLIVDIDKVEIGLNAPPYHPYCRTVLSPYYEGNEPETRMYRPNGNGKSTKGRYRIYDQFLEEELGDKKKAEAIRSTRNDLTTLLVATASLSVPETIEPDIKYTNPNYESELPDKDRETLLTMKGPTINNINSKLSNGEELGEEIVKKIEEIDSALDKLQYYNGEVTTDIKPGNNNPLDGLGIGDIWQPKKYLFSTKKNKYYDNAKYRLVIVSKTGRDIGKKISNYKINKEVIFKRNTKFKIVDIKVKNDTVYYYLSEYIDE